MKKSQKQKLRKFLKIVKNSEKRGEMKMNFERIFVFLRELATDVTWTRFRRELKTEGREDKNTEV